MLFMTRVLAGGVFDLFHEGHEHFLSEAKKLGDELVVVVASDKNAERATQSQVERAENVEKCSYVDCVVLGSDSLDFLRVLDAEKPDILAIGYDQELKISEEVLNKRQIKVVRISSSVPGVSSSILRTSKT